MNNRHPWQLKKSKFWGPFWSYQLNSTANSAYSPQKWVKWVKLAVLFNWQLQNGPQNFSIAMGVNYSFEFVFIEIYAPQFIGHNKIFLGSVRNNLADLGFQCPIGNCSSLSTSIICLSLTNRCLILTWCVKMGWQPFFGKINFFVSKSFHETFLQFYLYSNNEYFVKTQLPEN